MAQEMFEQSDLQVPLTMIYTAAGLPLVQRRFHRDWQLSSYRPGTLQCSEAAL